MLGGKPPPHAGTPPQGGETQYVDYQRFNPVMREVS
jgi:hypothetical protein